MPHVNFYRRGREPLSEFIWPHVLTIIVLYISDMMCNYMVCSHRNFNFPLWRLTSAWNRAMNAGSSNFLHNFCKNSENVNQSPGWLCRAARLLGKWGLQAEGNLLQETLLLSMFMMLGKDPSTYVSFSRGINYPHRHMVPHDQPDAAFVSYPFFDPLDWIPFISNELVLTSLYAFFNIRNSLHAGFLILLLLLLSLQLTIWCNGLNEVYCS